MKAILCMLKEGLKVQESSSKIMSFLVQDLLDYAQIRAGKFRKNLKTFDIREAIEKVMCIQRRKAQAQNIDLEVEYHDIKDPMVRTDEERVLQVLLGLQSNALKFTQKGGVKIHVFV